MTRLPRRCALTLWSSIGAPLRGITVYDSNDIDEVRGWLVEDPVVSTGTLRADVRLWWSTPGTTLAP
jgi:hypothetical protein